MFAALSKGVGKRLETVDGVAPKGDPAKVCSSQQRKQDDGSLLTIHSACLCFSNTLPSDARRIKNQHHSFFARCLCSIDHNCEEEMGPLHYPVDSLGFLDDCVRDYH